jgi:hypothetical protein
MTIISNLTKLPGVPDSGDAVPGMAHFAGSGPYGETCGGCVHRGYYRQAKTGKWNPQTNTHDYSTYRHPGCAMFKKLTGRAGPAVSADNQACKYFEPP